MDLVKLLMQQVGVSEGQASGGLGLILQLLQSQLEGTQYEQIAQYIPMAAQLIKAAPDLDNSGGGGGLMGMVGKVLPALGGGSQLGALAQVAGGFSELGMEPEQAGDFMSVMSGFLQQQGGDEAAGLLSQVLN